MKKRSLIIIVSLSIIFSLGIVAYNLLSNSNSSNKTIRSVVNLLYGRKIEVVNKSKYYEVEYRTSGTFMNILNDWGVWRENNIGPENQSGLYSINKVIVVITNATQSATDIEPLSKATSKIDNYGNLSIEISLSSELKQSPEVNKNDLVLHSVLERLYVSSHRNYTQETKNREITKALTEIRNAKVNEPFIVNTKEENQ